MDKLSVKVFTVVFTLVFLVGTAIAAGNFYIPGSRDLEGGIGEDGKSFEKLHVGNRVVMEGDSSDAFETTIFATDPTADRTLTLPNASGTIALTTGSSSISINTVTVTIPAGQIGSSDTVESGSVLLGWLPISGISNTFVVNSISVQGTALLTNTSAHSGSMVMNAILLRP
jgi:hypothetical protein